MIITVSIQENDGKMNTDIEIREEKKGNGTAKEVFYSDVIEENIEQGIRDAIFESMDIEKKWEARSKHE